MISEVPEPPGQQDVDVLGDEADLPINHIIWVIGLKGREQRQVLEREAVLRVVQHVLQSREHLLGRFYQPQVLAAVELQVAIDEPVEVVARLEADLGAGLTQPAVKLGADPVEVFGSCALAAFTDLRGVLAAQPGLEEVGLDLLARLVEVVDPVAPAVVGRRPLGLVVDVRQQVALEHVRWAQGQAAIVHRLEDRVGIVVRVGRDLHEMHVLEQPVDEVRQCLMADVVGQRFFEVAVACIQVLDGLASPVHVERLIAEQRIHALGSLGHVEVEGLLPELLGHDEFVDVDLVHPPRLEVPQQDQQKRQARKSLLPIDDVARALLLAEDDRAKEVVGVVRDLGPRVGGIELLEELAGQVIDKLADLLVAPLVLTLEVVDRVLRALEHLADGLGLAEDFVHGTWLPHEAGATRLTLLVGRRSSPERSLTRSASRRAASVRDIRMVFCILVNTADANASNATTARGDGSADRDRRQCSEVNPWLGGRIHAGLYVSTKTGCLQQAVEERSRERLQLAAEPRCFAEERTAGHSR